ncbi:MAG: M28 family peptidase [Flavobacteriales bacterium]|nr:M28 family peptidase [Flavobacteriales bacterium]
MKKLAFLLSLLSSTAFAQTNIHFANPEVTDIVAGDFDEADYEPSNVFDDPHAIAAELTNRINPDSLKSYLEKMSSFETRHTSSDTMSSTRGMGAARTWALNKFDQFSAQNENRLISSYLQFDENICDVTRHKNIVAVLPGIPDIDSVIDPFPHSVVFIEAHFDSRCNTSCDTGCVANGMEDNGSGSALVLELARIMSKYKFKSTILFMLTTGEEQGLNGSNAMAQYCEDNNINVRAVLNNDVIGGITCGETSSPPSCPGLNDIDSTQVRFFSAGIFNSRYKQLTRYVKLQYKEELEEHVKVPMDLTIMNAEDRTGRGGDHIPFRQRGYLAMRFTSANEHGDAGTADTNYHDRQHTSDDILGVDTDNDGDLDSFYVDFNYLARNAAINANAATMLAQDVCSDLGFEVVQKNWHQVTVQIGGDWCAEGPFRIAYRTETNDWDTLVTTDQYSTDVEVTPGNIHFFSVCRLNSEGIESLFTGEQFIDIVGVDEPNFGSGIKLLQNKPNPFDETTSISYIVYDMPQNSQATIVVRGVNGRIVSSIKSKVQPGVNEVLYDHGYGQQGTFFYSLMIDGKELATKKMVFVAN